MLKRTGKIGWDDSLTRGPGNLSKALGIHTQKNGTSLISEEIYLIDDGFVYPVEKIKQSARIGVAYAGEDAFLPYRYYVEGNPFVSGKPR